jgi:hypothetical protein
LVEKNPLGVSIFIHSFDNCPPSIEPSFCCLLSSSSETNHSNLFFFKPSSIAALHNRRCRSC